MNKFTAIDFETATGYRNSICQIGLVRIENGITSKEINLLVQPPENSIGINLATFMESHQRKQLTLLILIKSGKSYSPI